MVINNKHFFKQTTKNTRTGNLHFLKVKATFERQIHGDVFSDSKVTKYSKWSTLTKFHRTNKRYLKVAQPSLEVKETSTIGIAHLKE